MARMTVCLLNWKRPENVIRIIRDLRAQDAKPQIFLWDNAPNDHTRAFDTDWTVKSSENKRCWPRWWMATMAKTEYIMSLDDDLTPTDPQFITDLIAFLDTAGDRAVGLEGILLRPGKRYAKCAALGIPQGTHEVDIIKGRLLSFRSSLLKLINLEAMQTNADDIVISSMLGQGLIKHWLLPNSMAQRIENLPEPFALWRQEGHFERRDAAVKKFFPWHK